MIAKDILFLNLLSDLRNAAINDGAIAFLIGRLTVGDGLGGFYRWNASSTSSEDTTFLNFVASNKTAVGMWERIFQKAKSYPQGILVNNGGVRSVYIPTTTDANGEVIVNLTEDNTATGVAMFTEIWFASGQVSLAAGATATTPIIGSEKSRGVGLKTIRFSFNTGNTQTLGSTLLSIVGLAISGLRAVPAGTPVIIKIEGI